jgi:hypothetical protein
MVDAGRHAARIVDGMYTLHCTRKLLDRLKTTPAPVAPEPTTRLGNWYATALFWKPQAVLAVNERTLLPVLLPLAPATTITARLPDAIATMLEAIGIPDQLITDELTAMHDGITIAKTANRSVLGIINEFTFLAEHHTANGHQLDHHHMALRLANTPCGPLYKSTSFPDAETRLLLTGEQPHWTRRQGSATPPNL